MLPLSVWGQLKPLSAYKQEMKERGESKLNCFELGPPYAGMALVLDDRPARFVNDSRGIASKPNIHFMQHPDVRELLDEERLHMLLHARVVLHIEAGEQLLCNYSDGYWQKSGGGLAQSVPEEEEKKVQDSEEEPQDEESDEEDEESKEPEGQQERPSKQKGKEKTKEKKTKEKKEKKGKEKKKKGRESRKPEAIVVSESDDDEASAKESAEGELPSEEAVGSRRKKPAPEAQPDKQKKRRRLFEVEADDENEDLLSVSQRMTAAKSVSQSAAAVLPLWGGGSRAKKGF